MNYIPVLIGKNVAEIVGFSVLYIALIAILISVFIFIKSRKSINVVDLNFKNKYLTKFLAYFWLVFGSVFLVSLPIYASETTGSANLELFGWICLISGGISCTFLMLSFEIAMSNLTI